MGRFSNVKNLINMRFVRKNVFLVGFMLLSALGVLALLVLSFMQYFEMSKSIEKTNKLRDDNDKLIRRRIPAVNENIDRVQTNIDNFRELEKKTAVYFGQPLYPALEEFCKKLKITPHELRENFKSFYTAKNYNDKELASVIYKNFRDSQGRGINNQNHALWTYDENSGGINKDRKGKKLPLWEDAIDAFKKKAQLTTIEAVETHNTPEIFLSCLGVPRNMGNSDNALLNLRQTMIEKISEMFTAEGVDIDILGINFFQKREVSKLKTSSEFNDGTDRNIQTSGEKSSSSNTTGTTEDKTVTDKANEILHWDIVSDLARRLCAAKVNTIEEISYKDLNGTDSGSCKFYTYTLSVTGSEESVRNLINNLNDAYKDHRVYIVKNFSISKQEDQIQDILDFAQQRIGQNAQNKSEFKSGDNEVSMAGDNSQKVVVYEDFYRESNKYPECVAGRSNVVSATLVLDYVVYKVNVK